MWDNEYVSTLRILVVDDVAINRKILQLMLSRIGYAADLVTNGMEAIEDLKKQHYDVIFMDLQMPILDGIRATRIIRENCASKDQPYIITITAYEDRYSWEMCKSAGMDDFVTKPVSFDDIRNLMESAEKYLKKKSWPLSIESYSLWSIF